MVWAFILIASVVSLMSGDKLNRIIVKSSKYIYHAIKSYVLMLVLMIKISKGLQIKAGRQAQYNILEAGVLDEPNSQLTPLSGVAAQARQST